MSVLRLALRLMIKDCALSCYSTPEFFWTTCRTCVLSLDTLLMVKQQHIKMEK